MPLSHSLSREASQLCWVPMWGARAQGKVKYACSEEVPEPVDLQGEGFSVAFDPLDGSSIVDTNFTVGTIFGVWPGDKLTGITGRDQVCCLQVPATSNPGYHPHICWSLSFSPLNKIGCKDPLILHTRRGDSLQSGHTL